MTFLPFAFKPCSAIFVPGLDRPLVRKTLVPSKSLAAPYRTARLDPSADRSVLLRSRLHVIEHVSPFTRLNLCDSSIREANLGHKMIRTVWLSVLCLALFSVLATAKRFGHPPVIGDLRKRPTIAALALEFCILTAARSGEVLGARWSEMDLAKRLWTVPAHRMKAGREHRVPLSNCAMSILKHLRDADCGEFVFPGQKPKKPLSHMAMEMVLRRMKIENATVHGFRSSFRDWAGNVTSFPREVTETALAHVIGDKAEHAYRRGDALDKRRALMDAWAAYCEPKAGGNVVGISI